MIDITKEHADALALASAVWWIINENARCRKVIACTQRELAEYEAALAGIKRTYAEGAIDDDDAKLCCDAVRWRLAATGDGIADIEKQVKAVAAAIVQARQQVAEKPALAAQVRHLALLPSLVTDDDASTITPRPILDACRETRANPRLRYIYLLCAAGEHREVTGENDGATGLTEVQARFRLRLPYVRRQLESLVQANLVRTVDGLIVVNDWAIKQKASDDAAARKRMSRDMSRDMSQGCPVLDTDTDTDTDTEEPITPPNGGVVPAKADACPPCPYDSIVELYHQSLPANPRLLALNDARRGAMKSRWREGWERLGRQGKPREAVHLLNRFALFFEHVAKSDFLTGRTPAREGRAPFVATLDWLMKPSNFLNVLEGAYHP